MSWFKELTSKAEAVLVKLDQNAAQALQNPTSILSDLTYTRSESDVSNETEEFLKHGNQDDSKSLSDTVICSTIHQDELEVQVHRVAPETTSNLTLIGSSELISERSTSSKVTTNQTLPGDSLLERSKSNQAKRKIHVEEPVDVHSNDTEIKPSKSTVHSKRFPIQTSRTNSNLFSEINTRDENGKTRFEREGSDQNLYREQIPNFVADDIRASINQTLKEYSTTYSTSPNSKSLDSTRKNSNHNHPSHFDNQPYIVHDQELSPSLIERNSTLSFSIDFPDNCEVGPKTGITARLVQQNIAKRKSTFNLQRVINKIANINASDYIVLSHHKRVRLRRFKLRLATYVRRLSHYFQNYPNMKYYAIGYVILMQLLVVYVLFFYQSTPTSSDFGTQINN